MKSKRCFQSWIKASIKMAESLSQRMILRTIILIRKTQKIGLGTSKTDFNYYNLS